MQVTETKSEGLKHEFKVILPAAEIDEKLIARLEQVGREVRLAGFRPGKVPESILRQRYGTAVMNEVIEQAVNDSSSQAIMERDLRPALQPKVEVTTYEEGADLEYTLEIEVLPQIELPDLSALTLNRRVVEIRDEEVNESIERIAAQYSQTAPLEKERPAQKGDVLVLDFVGKVDGEAFPGGAAQDHHLELGSNSFIEGFEDQLVGLKSGDHADLNIRFPDEYVNDKLAGKDAIFEVDIKEIREKTPLPVDDDLAKVVGMESLDALRQAVRKQIESEYGTITRAHLKRGILDELADKHDFAVPQGMLNLEFDAIWARVQEDKAQDKLDPEDKEKSEDELEKEYKSIAERRVRLGLLLSEIGRVNNIDVSQEEISRAVLEEARRMPGQEKQVMDFYKGNPQALANLRAPVFEDKVIDFIVEMADVSDTPVTVEELLAPPESDTAEKTKPAKKGAAKTKTASGSKKAAGKKKAAAKKAPSKSAKKD
ncbi:MAG: trigger factor [Hyphomicrobiales bacterium]|nr:trigger factor [Hyphomicrobiales bacterium]